MMPSLASLIALQELDTAAETARRRLAELPAAEAAIEQTVTSAAAAVDAVKARQQENQHARRALEKDVAGVDTRLARFNDHKAAVKTNQEYTALLHEIATATQEKDAIEEKILVLMEAADGLAAELKAADAALAKAKREGADTRGALQAEKATLDTDLARLARDRSRQTSDIEPRALGIYDQLIKGRRGLAVAAMRDGHCTACNVRLRPHVEQTIRRNESLIQCESCHRILYFKEKA